MGFFDALAGGSSLDERSAGVHLHGIEVRLSQPQAGEGQQGADVSTEGGEAELHRQLGHRDPGRGQKTATGRYGEKGPLANSRWLVSCGARSGTYDQSA